TILSNCSSSALAPGGMTCRATIVPSSAPHGEGQRPLDLGPLVGRLDARAREHAPRLGAGLSAHHDPDARWIGELDAEARRADRLREPPQQALEHLRHARL